MKKRIAVITNDSFLYQKIYLILKRSCIIQRDVSGADLCFWDKDSMGEPDLSSNTLVLSRAGGDLKIPFTEESLTALVHNRKDRPSMVLGEKCVYLYGREIRLTEVEFALLSELVSAGGDFVDRDTLISSVWGDGADGGVLNVYIHYLREKLERNGEKIIVSSRKNGYKIEKKFLSGEVEECSE